MPIYFPTLAPSHVLHQQRWRHVFRADIDKAFRVFHNKLSWKDPEMVFRPSPAQVYEMAQSCRQAGICFWDTETDGIEPLTCRLRCFGFGATRDKIVVVPFWSVDGVSRLEDTRSSDVLRELMQDASVLWVGQNSTVYDTQVVRQQLGVSPVNQTDTLLIHHCVESEMPHKLQYLGSVYSDVFDWKEEHGGQELKTDEELWRYNARDVSITAEVYERLWPEIALREQQNALRIDLFNAKFCVDMHGLGMRIDDAVVLELRKHWQEKLNEATVELGGVNPNSPRQVAKLLFDTLDLPYQENWDTDTGGQGTGMDVIRDLLADPSRTPEQQKYLKALHKARRSGKLINAFLEHMKGSFDGRLHPTWNPAGTVTGRLAGSRPNAQQWPKYVRRAVVPEPGHVFLDADFDQLEVRVMASMTGCKADLEECNKPDGDVHRITVQMVFGDTSKFTPKQFDELRDFSKRFRYAKAYGATDDKVWRTMRATEDPESMEFRYLNMKLAKIIKDSRAWNAGFPEYVKYWTEIVDKYRERFCLYDPVQHRRRDFLDGEDQNELINFPIQAAGVGVVQRAEEALYAAGVVPGFDGSKTGIVLQCHDSILIECREESAKDVQETMSRCMNLEAPELPGVKFTSKAKIKTDWAGVKKK